MRLILVIVRLACLLIIRGSKHNSVPAKKYRVNLDDPPSQRWLPVLQHFSASSVKATIQAYEEWYFHKDFLEDVIGVIAGDLNKYIPQPYAGEMQGIANYYGLPLGQIVLVNLGYELIAWNSTGFQACTSIVAMDKNGCVVHGKNNDYHPTDLLRNISADIEFVRNGKIEFLATTYVGCVGVMIATKPAAFAISINQRLSGRLWENILAAFERHWPTDFWIREVLANAVDYEDAVKMLSKGKTTSPVYAIVAGVKPQEGAIVVVDRWGADGVIRMKDFDDGWFLVQTNYEPWTRPPTSDNRRDPAIKLMKSYGEKRTTLETLYRVLSTPPIFNHKTVFTTVMSVHNISTYKTMLRYDRPNKLTSKTSKIN